MDEWTTTTTTLLAAQEYTTTTTTHICAYTSHRRPGYGRVLLQHAMQTCIKRGATMAFVSVQTSKGLSHHHGQWSRETFRTTHPIVFNPHPTPLPHRCMATCRAQSPPEGSAIGTLGGGNCTKDHTHGGPYGPYLQRSGTSVGRPPAAPRWESGWNTCRGTWPRSCADKKNGRWTTK